MATRTTTKAPPRGRRTNTSTKSRATTGSSGPASSRNRSTRKAPVRRTSRSRRPTRRRPGAISIALAPVTKLVASLWMGLAHLVGSAARGIGSSAKNLEPALRRDGAGLALIGLAVVIGASVWANLSGSVPDLIRMAVTGLVGTAAIVVPILLLMSAWRRMRKHGADGTAGRAHNDRARRAFTL